MLRKQQWCEVVRCFALLLIALCAAVAPQISAAQDANAGKALYNTPLVSGQLSCGAGACHGPDPLARQNRIQNGDTPGGIGLAINTVTQMAFLRGQVTAAQITNIAAYIADPASATGAPIAALSSSALSFSPTRVGQSAVEQNLTITNSGSAALVIGSVSTTSSDFTATHSCSTIAVAANCVVTLGFTPTASGTRSATLNVTHNAAGGSSAVALSGAGIIEPLAVATPSAIDFGGVLLGSASDVRTVTVTNAGNAALRLINLSINGDAFTREGGSCLQGASIAPGSFCTIGLRFNAYANGGVTGALLVDHNAVGGTEIVSLSGQGFTGVPEIRVMTEYQYTPLNYYFITSRDSDKALLDQAAGFQRTGLQFNVYAAQGAGMVGVNRYYFDKAALQGARGTHFYTLLANEKDGLAALNPNNLTLPLKPYNEGTDSFAYPPLVEGVGGSCTAGLVPVYRIFRGNVRFPDDPNHRFTSNASVYQSMIAAGWDNEGVKFCTPP